MWRVDLVALATPEPAAPPIFQNHFSCFLSGDIFSVTSRAGAMGTAVVTAVWRGLCAMGTAGRRPGEFVVDRGQAHETPDVSFSGLLH